MQLHFTLALEQCHVMFEVLKQISDTCETIHTYLVCQWVLPVLLICTITSHNFDILIIWCHQIIIMYVVCGQKKSIGNKKVVEDED